MILCQDRPVLGGNASSEVRQHIVGANGMEEGNPLDSEAREGGIIEEIRLRMCVENPQRSASMLDLALYDLCRKENNLKLMLNSRVVEADVRDGSIQSIRVERPSTEHNFVIHAATFVDCTGDGRLAKEAGEKFRQGREGQSDYNESFAQLESDSLTLGSTLLYQAKKHDRPMPYRAPSWARNFTAEDLKLRPIGQPGLDLNLEYGFWWVEWGGQYDTVSDNEEIRDELLSIVLGVWDYIKNASTIDAENWALDWVGFVPGKRESRRFNGLYTLVQDDLMTSADFPDAIATGGWPIDTHPPHGVDSPEEPPATQRTIPFLYEIPLRCCVSRSVKNLLFAGRNLSATHIAFASTRVMATCASVGQGVGTAIAYAHQNRLEMRDIPGNQGHCRGIQQWLLRDDAMLLRHKNEDSEDLARIARVSASSEQAYGSPKNCIDGYTRSVHGCPEKRLAQKSPICAPEGIYPEGTHRWMSDPKEGFPAWIELAWENKIGISSLELTFDTGLHRLLTLSQADGYTEKMKWGETQPETVTAYRVDVEKDGSWMTVVQVNGNYQRKVRHILDRNFEITKLRFIAQKTGNIDHARLFEVRVYS